VTLPPGRDPIAAPIRDTAVQGSTHRPATQFRLEPAPPREVLAQGTAAVLAFPGALAESAVERWQSKILIVGEARLGRPSSLRPSRALRVSCGGPTAGPPQSAGSALSAPITFEAVCILMRQRSITCRCEGSTSPSAIAPDAI